MSSSPMPPMTSGSKSFSPGVPFAARYSTSGSAPSTRSLVVSVSVALMPTLRIEKPASSQRPSLRSALGSAV